MEWIISSFLDFWISIDHQIYKWHTQTHFVATFALILSNKESKQQNIWITEFIIWRSLCSVWPLITCCFSDFHSSASLTVSPDRAQHFTYHTVSLSCGGNSTEWRVMRLNTDSRLSNCSSWAIMNRNTCSLRFERQSYAVYWCESQSGEFSNAVNITIQSTVSLYLFFFLI